MARCREKLASLTLCAISVLVVQLGGCASAGGLAERQRREGAAIEKRSAYGFYQVAIELPDQHPSLRAIMGSRWEMRQARGWKSYDAGGTRQYSTEPAERVACEITAEEADKFALAFLGMVVNPIPPSLVRGKILPITSGTLGGPEFTSGWSVCYEIRHRGLRVYGLGYVAVVRGTTVSAAFVETAIVGGYLPTTETGNEASTISSADAVEIAARRFRRKFRRDTCVVSRAELLFVPLSTEHVTTVLRPAWRIGFNSGSYYVDVDAIDRTVIHEG